MRCNIIIIITIIVFAFIFLINLCLAEETSNNCSSTWLDFDGVNDYVDVPLNSINIQNASSITFTFWFYPKSFGGYKGLLFLGTADNRNGYYIKMDYVNNQTLFARTNDTSSGFEGSTGTNSITLNTWNNLVLTFNGTIRKVYLNGVLKATRTETTGVSVIQNSTTKLYLGNAFEGGSDGLNGSMDKIMIFNYSFNDIENSAFSQSRSSPYINYSFNSTEINYARTILYINSTLLYIINSSSDVLRSNDKGISYTKIYSLGGETANNLFYSSKGNLYIALNGLNQIRVSIGNDTNWTTIQPGISSTASFWSIDEDSLGNLYISEYGSKAYIHKSTNNGLNWIPVYNATSYGWNADHMHWLGVDKLTNYVYATQGDGTGKSRMIRSIDSGNTWTTLRNVSDDDQYTTGVFSGDNLFLGMDRGANISIMKYDTTTGIFYYLFTLPSIQYNAVFDRSSVDKKGNIYFSTSNDGIGNDSVVLLTSKDNGTSWYKVFELNTSVGYTGFRQLTSFDDNGYAFLTDTANLKTYYFNVLEPTKYSNNNLFYNFNENSGTTAYDSSGNGNHGTIYGATWKNESICAIEENPYNQRLSILESWKQTIDAWKTTITNTINGLITRIDSQQEEINILKTKVSDLENKNSIIPNGVLPNYFKYLSSSVRKNIVCGYAEDNKLTSIIDLGYNCTITYRTSSSGRVSSNCRCNKI